jgi:bifunctional DNA-binding transcriptional regulator/antitoxin component of YhaV-PrlF toxin-antitoxin module
MAVGKRIKVERCDMDVTLKVDTMDDGLGIVIPDDVAEAHDLQLGDEVELVRTADGRLELVLLKRKGSGGEQA